jgi:drug/metabolite transporter (DMT)-like permease
MQVWQQAAFGAACLIAAHYLLLRASSGRVGDSLGALVLEATASVGILLAYALGPRGDRVPTTGWGLGYAALSGICISGASILLFFTLRRGGPVATTGTLVLGGGVTLSALFAPLFFSEAFTVRRAVGVALGVAALVVLGTERVDNSAPPNSHESQHAQDTRMP